MDRWLLDWNVLKLWYITDYCNCQIATYIEDFENERKDRERLVAVCDQQRRDLQVLRAEKKSVFQQVGHSHISIIC